MMLELVRLYWRCEFGHRFERGPSTQMAFCPKCGGKVKLYGLADSTRYTDAT